MAYTVKNKAGRHEAREAVFTLLFETEYHDGETPEVIFLRAAEEREFDAQDVYIKKTYFGVIEHMTELDALIGRCANGWKISRLSHVSRAVLRLGTYEMVFAKVPAPIAINEAIELFKTFDDPASKTKSFVNGVLNAVKDIVNSGEAVGVLSQATETPVQEETDESVPATAQNAELKTETVEPTGEGMSDSAEND